MTGRSDVQPLLWIADLDAAMAWYRDRLGFVITVFGQADDGGVSTCLASLDGAAVLLSRDSALALTGDLGSGHVRLYFHLGSSVDMLHASVRDLPDVEVVQVPTTQWWGDRTMILRDPWGTLLVFSSPSPP
ncbi:MAG TPA: VOC family protein [Thermomicrobiales bacterium]|nr:VOC family protein [Thermomicrobiales bacterium]